MNNKKYTFYISLITGLLLMVAGCGGGGGGGGASGAAISNIPAGSVTLTWDSPTTNSDGSPLNDLAGYTFYYGSSSGNYTNSVDVGNNTGYSLSSLSSGSWCFAVKAYDNSRNESSYSNEDCVTL